MRSRIPRKNAEVLQGLGVMMRQRLGLPGMYFLHRPYGIFAVRMIQERHI